MITIIDYGVGNIKAFTNIYKQLGISIKIAQNAKELDGATKLILPGVGHFDYAMQRFASSGMLDKTSDLVLNARLPLIGVCVGMQMLAKTSDEGRLPGLGWIDAEVKKFDPTKIKFETHLPHMGWNDVTPTKENLILRHLETNAKFYFLHSYYFSCNQVDDSIAISNYGINFTCVINHQNIFGVQFHPEKSHHYGIQLLKSFSEL